MKLQKMVLALLLVLIFSAGATACSGSNNTGANASADKEAVTVYEEKDITQASGIHFALSSKINSKNQLVISDYDSKEGTLKYVTLDAGGKRAGEIEAGIEGDESVFALDLKDNLYALSQKVVTDGNSDKPKYTELKLRIYSSGGKETKSIDLGKKDPEGEQAYRASAMEIDAEGNIYLLRFGSKIEVLDPDGKPIRQLESSNYNSMAVCEDGNLAVTSWGGAGKEEFRIEKLDASSGESMWRRSLTVNTGDQFISCNKANKCIYVTDIDGIRKYDSAGQFTGYAIKYSSYSIPGLNRFIAGITSDAADNLYVLSRSGNFSENSKEAPVLLYKYSPALEQGKDKKADPVKELGIAIPTMQYNSGNRFIDNAVKVFEQKHPGFKVNIKEYGSVQDLHDLSEREKYDKTISTEIMAGKGTDLISVSNLPYQKYIDKGVLLNLSDSIKEDAGFKTGDYYANILDACKYKGNLYAMPISFMFSAMIADKEVLEKEAVTISDTGWTVEDFLEIAEKVTKDTNNDGAVDRYALPNINAQIAFAFLGGNDLGRFVDYEKKEARFGSKEFIDLLKTSKEVVDKKLCNPQVELTDVYNLTNRGGTVFIAQGCWAYMGMYSQMALFNGNGRLYHFPAAYKGEKAEFEPQLFYGINKGTKYPEECWEFLRIMLSEELQATRDLPGFPVNIAAQKQNAGQTLGYKDDLVLGKIENKLPAIGQKDIDYMDKLISELGRTSIMDIQVINIVQTELKAFFSGAKSAEDTASAIQRKVDTYLHE
jgi:ABC-type glycerol-3-phosphate transport system substrate-binding protein